MAGRRLPSDGVASRYLNNPVPSSRHTNKPERKPRSLLPEDEAQCFKLMLAAPLTANRLRSSMPRCPTMSI
jgi:hypothetical protein